MADKHKKPVILVQGFGWTGSGALIDFLDENEHIKFVFKEEIPYIKSLINIIEKIKRGEHVDFEDGSDEALFIGEIPKNFSERLHNYYQMKIDRFTTFSNIEKEEYKHFTLNLLKEIEKSSDYSDTKKESILDQIFYRYWEFLNSIFQEDSKILMFDNLFLIEKVHYLNIIDRLGDQDLYLYAVDRDPRDQFFELSNLYKSGTEIHYNKFLKKISNLKITRKLIDLSFFQFFAALFFINVYHKPRRKKFMSSVQLIRKSTGKLKIKKLMFEDFVLNTNQTRDKIKSEFDSVLKDNNLDSRWHENKYFISEQSAKNIHKFKNSKNRKVYKFILKRVNAYNNWELYF